jgi:hypothetical protein
MLHDNKNVILGTFDLLKDEIEKFERELDLSKAPSNVIIAKRIEEQLHDLLTNSQDLNK